MNKQTFTIFISGILFGIFGFLLFNPVSGSTPQDKITPVEQEGAANTLIDFSNGEVTFCAQQSIVKDKSVFSLLKDCLEEKSLALAYEDYDDMGVLVEQIGNKKGGEDGRYWQYWVNGEYAKTSSNSYKVGDNDVILWKFEEFKNQ